MKGIISVIVPVYNVNMYLDKCIQSIVNQSYQQIEIILVDDGSTDNSGEICDRWEAKDSRIKVIHKENGGLASARNTGLDIAVGKYIAFVDSDDYIRNDMYENMIKCMKDNQSDLVCCGRYRVDKNGIKEQFTLKRPKTFTTEEALKEWFCNGCINEAAWDKVYKSTLFENIRFPNGELNEDMPIMPYLFSRCQKITHIGEPFYYYVQRLSGSITTSVYNRKKGVAYDHLIAIETFVNAKYPILAETYKQLEAKYAFCFIVEMAESNTCKKYMEDYQRWKTLLRRTMMAPIRENRVNLWWKMEAFLMLFGVYPPYVKVKKWYLKHIKVKK